MSVQWKILISKMAERDGSLNKPCGEEKTLSSSLNAS